MFKLVACVYLVGYSVLAQLTTGDITQSLKVMNTERRRFGLQAVNFNYTVQEELNTIPDNYWFNTSLNQTHEFYLGDEKRVRPYNLYFHNSTEPFKYLFHDTVKTTMSSIFSHRVKQRKCFKLKKCSKDSFNMYYTCGGKKQDVRDSTKCSWFFHYYPRFLLKSLTQISCVLPPIEGPNVPNHLRGIQKKVFICFGNHKDPTSDNPLSN